MPLLRSREIPPTKSPDGKLPTPEPLTPTQTRETSIHQSPSSPTVNPYTSQSAHNSTSTRRRSLRLSSKSDPTAKGSVQIPSSSGTERSRKRKSVEEKEGVLGSQLDEGNVIDKMTPTQTRETSTHQSPSSPTFNSATSQSAHDSTSTRRRSLRLSSKSDPAAKGSVQIPKSNGIELSRKRKSVEEKEGVLGNQLFDESNMIDKMTEGDTVGEISLVLSLRYRKGFVKKTIVCSNDDSVIEVEGKRVDKEMDSDVKCKRGKGKRQWILGKEVLSLNVAKESVENPRDAAGKRSKDGVDGRNLEKSVSGSGSSRGKMKCSREVKMDTGEDGSVAMEELERSPSANECGTSRRRRTCTIEVKVEGDKEGVFEELEKIPITDDNGTSRRGRFSRVKKGKRVEEGIVTKELGKIPVVHEGGPSRGKRRYSREEKGKGKLVVDNGSISNEKDKCELDSKAKDLVDGLAKIVVLKEGKQDASARSKVPGSRIEQFHDIARENASRFAHFKVQVQQDHHDEEMPPVEERQQNVEDWPGPFSTAMKIIRDRTNRLSSQQGGNSSEKVKPVPITWIPNTDRVIKRSKGSVSSLKELCMRILVKNADAIASLEHVPDSLRHRLCQLLCDSRRMNGHFLALLVRGSPTEIRIRDCSWLAEEEFTKCFGGCDTSNLSALQLDQCGRCMADYILLSTLTRKPGSLPMLTNLSISGACRLSDVGLNSLVASAHALKSLNLSQCSLLTSASINSLADSLATSLRELYLNDCQSIDPMQILPAMKKLEHLEVLSLSGIETVGDNFLKGFIAARGHNLKELVLTDCVKLTDSSMKIVAESCSQLCALDLANLRKLTDSALGYLANGCREIHTLKLCRNAFSDEAIAAFVETSGERLRILSLNNVKKVGNSTALSLARCSRKLLSLDLSWCRNLTDEALGLIVDSCSSMRVLTVFGCSQITNVFLDGHSNSDVKIIGLKMSPVLEHVGFPEEEEEFPLRYSSVSSSI